jgi:hypothetical protein
MSHSFGTSRTYQRASRPHLHRLVIGIGPTLRRFTGGLLVRVQPGELPKNLQTDSFRSEPGSGEAEHLPNFCPVCRVWFKTREERESGDIGLGLMPEAVFVFKSRTIPSALDWVPCGSALAHGLPDEPARPYERFTSSPLRHENILQTRSFDLGRELR